MSEHDYPDLRNFFFLQEDKKRYKKCASQRARLGLAYCDTWAFDEFLLNIIIRGLRQLADNSHGYPGVKPFDSYESWTKFLLDLADKFARAKRYIYDEDDLTLTDSALASSVRAKKGHKILQEAFAELADWLPSMWD